MHFAGSKSQIPCAILDAGQFHNGRLVRYHLLLHFPRARDHRWKAGRWSDRRVPTVLRNGALFAGSDRRGKCARTSVPPSHWRYIMEFLAVLRSFIRPMLDYATRKWDENAKIIRRHYGYFESSVRCHCLLVCWHGSIRVLAIQRRSCRLDYAQFAERWIVSSWVRSERLICRQFAFDHISNISEGWRSPFKRCWRSVYSLRMAWPAMWPLIWFGRITWWKRLRKTRGRCCASTWCERWLYCSHVIIVVFILCAFWFLRW